VPVNFETGEAWWEQVASSGFDSGKPANAETLRKVATLAPGSTFVMSYILPIELADPEVRPGIERAVAGARANGTPFLSFFTPAFARRTIPRNC
jgi:hypothetical protein